MKPRKLKKRGEKILCDDKEGYYLLKSGIVKIGDYTKPPKRHNWESVNTFAGKTVEQIRETYGWIVCREL